MREYDQNIAMGSWSCRGGRVKGYTHIVPKNPIHFMTFSAKVSLLVYIC